jgi:hypothetical protein
VQGDRKTDMSTKQDKSQVKGNRQGGGDQTGKGNRPQGYIPPLDPTDEALKRRAQEARDPKGRAFSATLNAALNEPVEKSS